MSYILVPGIEEKKYIDLLFKCTKIRSIRVRGAVEEVMTTGMRADYAAGKYKTTARQVFRAIKALNKYHEIIERAHEMKLSTRKNT